MKKFIKEIVGFIFRLSGLSFLVREVICRNRAIIIVYHNPKHKIFKKHIDYLAKNYNLISLNRLVNAIYKKEWSDIPPKSVVITIDDGYRDNYKLLEIFKSYNVYPTIYLCSHIVNTSRNFWFRAGFRNLQKLKKYDNNQRLKILKEKISYEPQKEYSKRQSLNLTELREMLPYVDFQSHSKFHPILTTSTDKECKEEIGGSKIHLEKLLNKEIKHFSYPNGDYTEREIEYLKSYGYKSARTIDIGWNNINSELYRLKAIGVEDDASINILCGQVCGFFGYLKYLRYGSFKGIHPSFI
ncbi:MAG: polysaccharide deacetylase family protein [Candidatus Helarchaeota archaeon]